MLKIHKWPIMDVFYVIEQNMKISWACINHRPQGISTHLNILATHSPALLDDINKEQMVIGVTCSEMYI